MLNYSLTVRVSRSSTLTESCQPEAMETVPRLTVIVFTPAREGRKNLSLE